MRYIPVTLAILIWGWSEVLIKYLQEARFDPYSQNFYRYGASALVVLVWALASNREGIKSGLAKWWVFLLPALFGMLYQTLWVIGFYHLAPTFASLIGRSNIIVTIMTAIVFFPDERRLATDWRFLLATAMALASVSGVIAFHEKGTEGALVEGSFGWGVALVIIGSAMWVFYAFAAKKVVREMGAAVTFAGSSVMMSVVMFILAVIMQAYGSANLSHIADVGPLGIIVLFGSGILCVGIAQSIYYRSIDLIGVSLSQILTLVIPLIVGIISFLMYGERLTVLQWASGIVLLVSLAYIIDLNRKIGASE
jgi:drug/metabolite transporter (DMT)-like permease